MNSHRFAQLLDAEMPEGSGSNIMSIPATHLPPLIRTAGDRAGRRFVEYFTAHIRNPGTRAVYARAVNRFCCWCDRRSVTLQQVSPFIVAGYIEQLTHQLSAPTVKLHLAAIRMLFDFLVVGQVLPVNPAASVRGPKHVVNVGKTPVLSADEARLILDSVDVGTIGGLRDRALIGVMVFSFARVSAAIGMNVEDFYLQGRRMWFRLHEKGGKHHTVPAHHNAEQYVHDYLDAAGIADQKKSPLYRTLSRQRRLTATRMQRADVLRMVKRRARQVGLPEHICCHTFRATGITCYLQRGGSLDHAARIACHESARTTKLYDRTGDTVSLDEIERIAI